VLQIANPGTGGSGAAITTYENIAFYDADGDLVIGPNDRIDITIIHNSAVNFWKRHKQTRFNQVQFSTTRPTQDLLWSAIGAGTFSIITGSDGGRLEIQTGSSAAGDGGSIIQDFNTFELVAGTKILFLLELAATTDQLISIGAQLDSNNQVYLRRSDLASEGTWFAHCTSGGTDTSVDTGVKTGTNRIQYGIDFDGTTVGFWVGNTNNTLLKYVSTTTNIPTGQLLKPFLKFTSQSAAVNRQLFFDQLYFMTAA
jgi:hypothetical protein